MQRRNGWRISVSGEYLLQDPFGMRATHDRNTASGTGAVRSDSRVLARHRDGCWTGGGRRGSDLGPAANMSPPVSVPQGLVLWKGSRDGVGHVPVTEGG
jgi:hypothetical protein